MKVARDLIAQPEVFVWKFNRTSAPTIVTEDVTTLVEPRSTVEKSVNSTAVPFHTDIISPVLALEPLVTVYLKNAEVKDPVALVNKLLEPTIEDATVA